MAQLTGQRLLRIESMQLNTSALGGFAGVGSLVVRTDGIEFYRSKGALLAGAAFGILGLFATKNKDSSEPTREYHISEIERAEAVGGIAVGLKIRLKDGSTLHFTSKTRTITGKGEVNEVAAKINELVLHQNDPVAASVSKTNATEQPGQGTVSQRQAGSMSKKGFNSDWIIPKSTWVQCPKCGEKRPGDFIRVAKKCPVCGLSAFDE